ncbi:MAG: FtsX-like permease family protein [Ilumatobacteraceae bacterium]
MVVRVDAIETAWETAQGWVTGSSPSHQLENEFDFRSINDTTNNWIVLAFATAASVALVGAVLSAIDDRRSSRDWATLRALGVTVRHLVTIRLVLAAITSTLATIVAIVPALILSAAFLRVNEDSMGSFCPSCSQPSAGIATVMLVSCAVGGAGRRLPACAETRSWKA